MTMASLKSHKASYFWRTVRIGRVIIGLSKGDSQANLPRRARPRHPHQKPQITLSSDRPSTTLRSSSAMIILPTEKPIEICWNRTSQNMSTSWMESLFRFLRTIDSCAHRTLERLWVKTDRSLHTFWEAQIPQLLAYRRGNSWQREKMLKPSK